MSALGLHGPTHVQYAQRSTFMIEACHWHILPDTGKTCFPKCRWHILPDTVDKMPNCFMRCVFKLEAFSSCWSPRAHIGVYICCMFVYIYTSMQIDAIGASPQS